MIVFLLPHIVYVVAKLISWVAHFQVRYIPFLKTAAVLVLVWLALFFYGNRYGRFYHEWKNVSVSVAHLPESFSGYRIVHISDLHLDGWVGHEDELLQIVREINSRNADLIVFTGDLVSIRKDELTSFVPVLSQLKARDGVVSIMGNHDYMPYDRSKSARQNALDVAEVQKIEREQLGWTLLLNENVRISRGNDSIAVIGCENQSLGVHRVIQRGDIAKAAQGCAGMAKIILTHDPTHWRGEILKRTAADDLDLEGALTLSGHTHSGQFRVFGLSAASFVYDEYEGLYTEGNNNLYVNIGLGGTMPMRVGATPEITLITIR